MKSSASYTGFAKKAAHLCGRPGTFVLAALVIVVWLVTGPLFGFSDTWQLVINTGTTIITFLMVFLIQNTQNRDTEAMQEFRKRYQALATAARKNQDRGLGDTDSPEC
jgi:low affinity Fe/Cu permease